MNKNKFLEYLQLRAIIKARFNLRPIVFRALPNNNRFFFFTAFTSEINSVMSKIDGRVSLPTSKMEDLSNSPDSNFWIQMCYDTFRMTENANFQFGKYKVLHRTHYTE